MDVRAGIQPGHISFGPRYRRLAPLVYLPRRVGLALIGLLGRAFPAGAAGSSR
jgi:hypothetical protein